MQTNHYDALGLNADGFNGVVRYTEKEIKAAYRKCALMWHPDKSKDLAAKQKFEQLQKSHIVLSDSSERAVYDKELQENPMLLTANDSLFVDIDDPSGAMNQEEGSDSQELVCRPGINLTQIMLHANVSGEALLVFARELPDFSKAVLSNHAALESLSAMQHFQLLFIIEQHKMADASFTLSAEENKNSNFIIASVNSSHPACRANRDAFVSACFSNKELAPLFFNQFQEVIDNLDCVRLLALSREFYEMVVPLIKRHGASLRASEFYYILKQHPFHQADILSLCADSNNPHAEKFKVTAIYSAWLKKYLMNSELSECAQELSEMDPSLESVVSCLGLEAITISEAIISDASLGDQDNFSVLSRKAKTVLFVAIFMAYVKARSDSIRSMSLQEKKELSVRFIQFMGTKSTKSIMSQMGVDGNFVRLACTSLCCIFSDYSFRPELIVLMNYLPAIKNAEIKNNYETLLLQAGVGSDDTTCLTVLLKKGYSGDYKFIKNNSDLLDKYLKTEECTRLMSTSDSFKQKIMSWASRCQHPLSQSGVGLAFNTLNEHIQSKSAVTEDVFLELFAQTGFFPKLLLLKTDNPTIQFSILEKAAIVQEKLTSMDDANMRGVVEWFENVLLKGSKQQSNQLLTLYQEKSAYLILDKIQKPNTRSPLGNVKDVFAVLVLLESNVYWNKHYITGALLDNWFSLCDKGKDLRRQLIEAYYAGREVGLNYYSELFPLKRKIKDLKNGYDVCVLIGQFISVFESDFSQDDPDSSLSLYIKVSHSVKYRCKLIAYGTLKDVLFMIKCQGFARVNPGDCLAWLLSLLTESGVDLQTIDNISDALNTPTHESLFLALIVLIVDFSESINLSDKLRQTLSKHYPNNEKILTLAVEYLAIAQRYIQANHSTMHGDCLLALYEAHGEAVIPSVERYGLGRMLINGRKFGKIMSSIKEKSAAAFRNANVSTDDLVRLMNAELHSLLSRGLFDEEVAITREELDEFHAELSSLFAQNEISHSLLSIVLTLHPQLDKHLSCRHILMCWLFECVLSENDQDLKVYALQLFSGDDGKYEASKAPIEVLFDYIVVHKKSEITLEALENKFSEGVVDRMLVLYVQRINPSKMASSVDVACVKKLLRMQRLAFSELQGMSSDQFAQIMAAQVYLASPLFTDQLLKNHFFLADSKDGRLNAFVKNILGVEGPLAMNMQAILYQMYTKRVGMLNSDQDSTSTIEMINEFRQTRYFDFLSNNIFEKIDEEIDRLKGAGEKETVMKLYRGQLISIVADTAASAVHENKSIERLARDVHQQLCEKVNAIIKDPVLNKPRDPLKLFFKGLAGVLLAASALFLPLASGQYRTYFFSTTGVCRLSTMERVVTHCSGLKP